MLTNSQLERQLSISESDKIRDELFKLIPKDELDKLNGTLGEFCYEFPGFIEIYYFLSKIIPKSYTIIDFGAGHNAQSYFFINHKKYMAINPLEGIKEDDGMFCPPNCDVYRMTTLEFLQKVKYPKGSQVFAICNCVPNWHGHSSIELVKSTFQNCYTFYPGLITV